MLTHSGHAKTLEYDSRAPSISAADGLGSKFDGQSRPIAVIAPRRQNCLKADSAIIAQGLEAGGHRGMFLSADVSTRVGTFALVPQIVREVKLPVIAAGGIADAKGVALLRRRSVG